MKLREFIQRINQVAEVMSDYRLDEIEVCVVVKRTGGLGGTPVVPVKSAHCGIDWDNNKFMIFPEEPLVKVK